MKRYMHLITVFTFVLFFKNLVYGFDQSKILQSLNHLRSVGCNCAGDYYSPVSPLVWNTTLEDIVQEHTISMSRKKNLLASGKHTRLLNKRLKKLGKGTLSYNMHFAEGYPSFNKLFKDWLKDTDFCSNLMDESLKEVALAKTGNYWVLIFSSVVNPSFFVSPKSLDADKQIALDIVNKYRTSGCNCGNKYYPAVAKVSWNRKLEKAADIHAKDMRKNNFFEHKGSNGSQTADRVTVAGYDWWTCGENIAFGYDSISTVVEGWVKSVGHCENIMNRDYKEMGVSYQNGYWVQVFGAK